VNSYPVAQRCSSAAGDHPLRNRAEITPGRRFGTVGGGGSRDAAHRVSGRGHLPRRRRTLCRTNSNPERPTESPAGVVRVRAVVIDKNVAIAAITEERTAAFSDIGRRADPARRLRVEIAKLL
jgi:hypothetical protein